jgi:hypothetical protein
VTPRASFLALCLALPSIALLGCHTAASVAQNEAEQHALRESQREELAHIPPATKSRFMAVHTFDAWQNPYITVEPSMLILHVLEDDANPSNYGAGGLLRPVGARREDVTIAPGKLAEAMAAIPDAYWPYGRVVAIEEAHKTPASAEPQVRRTLETAVATLSDLGIAAYDINDGRMQ